MEQSPQTEPAATTALAPVAAEPPPAALAKRAAGPPPTIGLAPTTLNEAVAFARVAYASGTTQAKSPEQAAMIIVRALELGIPVGSALTSMNVINGKVCMPADLQVGLVKARRDVCEYFRLVSVDDAAATFETLRRGDPEPTRLTFTIAEAERAGLPQRNDNWKKYPRQMLKKRASAFLVRDVFPDLVAGLYDPDEMREVEPRPAARNLGSIDATFEPEVGPQRAADHAPLLRELAACASREELARLGKVVAGMKLPPSPLRAQLADALGEAKRRVEAAQ